MLPNKRKYYNFFLEFGLFWPFFNQKTLKNEENWQNPNHSVKFSKIWYIDAYQKKMLQKTDFRFRHFFTFLAQKRAKIDQNVRKLAKSKLFDKIF